MTVTVAPDFSAYPTPGGGAPLTGAALTGAGGMTAAAFFLAFLRLMRMVATTPRIAPSAIMTPETMPPMAFEERRFGFGWYSGFM